MSRYFVGVARQDRNNALPLPVVPDGAWERVGPGATTCPHCAGTFVHLEQRKETGFDLFIFTGHVVCSADVAKIPHACQKTPVRDLLGWKCCQKCRLCFCPDSFPQSFEIHSKEYTNEMRLKGSISGDASRIILRPHGMTKDQLRKAPGLPAAAVIHMVLYQGNAKEVTIAEGSYDPMKDQLVWKSDGVEFVWQHISV